MSWKEISRVNSYFTKATLDEMIWLNDYKTYGADSYVYNDKRILSKLCVSPIVSNDLSVNSFMLEIAINNNKHIGKWFGNIYGVDYAGASDLATIDAVMSDADMVRNIANCALATNALMGSDSARATLKANNTALGAFNESETYINNVLNSQYGVAKKATTSASQTGVVLCLSGTSNITNVEYDAGSGDSFAYEVAFAKAGLAYTALDGSVVTLCSAQSASGGGDMSGNYGTTAQPYSVTNYTINKFVNALTITNKTVTAGYSSKTATGSFSYIPL